MNLPIDIRVREARELEAEANQFYQLCGSNGKVDPANTLVLAYQGNKMVGMVRFCFEKDVHMLRTMRVHPNFQRRGIGLKILARFQSLLNENKIQKTLCLPYAHLVSFYGTIGFKQIHNESAPQFLQERLKQTQVNYPATELIIMSRISPFGQAPKA